MIALVGIISTSVMLHNYHFFLIFAIVRYQSPSQFDDDINNIRKVPGREPVLHKCGPPFPSGAPVGLKYGYQMFEVN